MTMTVERSDLALLDSNILIYATQSEAPQHETAKWIRDRAVIGHISACISPQVLTEFYAVVTNARRVTTPLTTEEAVSQIRLYLEANTLTFIFSRLETVERMLTLLEGRPVSGQDIHDLHLAATMLDNDVKKVYTYNADDFNPFSDIEVMVPSSTSPV